MSRRFECFAPEAVDTFFLRGVRLALFLTGLVAVNSLGAGGNRGFSQQPSAGEEDQSAGHAAEYVPPAAVVAVRIRADAIWHLPEFQWMPTEVAQAWSEVNLGLNLSSIEEVKLVAGIPMGPGTPPVGAVVRLTEDFDPTGIDPKLLIAPQPETVDGREVFLIGDRPAEAFYLHAIDPRKVLIAAPAIFQSMVSEPDGSGPLADQLRGNRIGDALAQAVVAVEPVRPMLSQVALQATAQLPPEIRDLSRVPELLSAAIVEVRLGAGPATLTAQLVTDDADSATQLNDILVRSLDFARNMFVANMNREIRDQGKIADAQRAYAERIADRIVKTVRPRQEDNRLVVETTPETSFASTGFLVGLLLPAVQSAREAARRMNASNNLKQIALAMHNYHDAYRNLPQAAITDDEGKPLLSWRVALLPFLEEQELYEEFHLDEPWDSPHNKQFIERMPNVFSDPSVPLPPGQTVFHAMTGEDYALEVDEATAFRDFTDGPSNTILVAEVSRDEAVPWTAPRDVKIDVDNPLAKMGRTHRGGFQAVLADGAVKFLSHAIDPGLFKALLTRAGGEVVSDF